MGHNFEFQHQVLGSQLVHFDIFACESAYHCKCGCRHPMVTKESSQKLKKT